MRGSQHRESELLRAEASIEERSGAFKKELELTDLVLTQILFIIGLGWIGTSEARIVARCIVVLRKK